VHQLVFIQRQNHFKTDGQSVSQSVNQCISLGVEPLQDSWPHFGCSRESWGFVCSGASSLSRGRWKAFLHRLAVSKTPLLPTYFNLQGTSLSDSDVLLYIREVQGSVLLSIIKQLSCVIFIVSFLWPSLYVFTYSWFMITFPSQNSASLTWVGNLTEEKSLVFNQISCTAVFSFLRSCVQKLNTSIHGICSVFISVNNVVIQCRTRKQIPWKHVSETVVCVGVCVLFMLKCQ